MARMKVMGDAAKENKAAAAESGNRGVKVPSTRPNVGSAGPEVKADMAGAMAGQPTDHNPLRAATRELHEQHPHEYYDHGPHHGTSEHIRHAPAVMPNGKHPFGR